MTITQLSVEELFALAKEGKASFWKSVQEEIETSVKVGKNRWGMGFSTFASTTDPKISALFKDRGYCQCRVTGVFLPEGSFITCYESYAAFLKKKPSFVSKKAQNHVFIGRDEILGVDFLERTSPILTKDFEFKNIAASHLGSLKQEGNIYVAQISRENKVYSCFNTNFYSNKKSPKDWTIPEGNTLGIEIEMLFPDVISKLRFSTYLQENHAGWHCEYDGSLQDHGNAGDCGLELISPPLLFDDIVKVVKPICEKALEFGGKGHPAGIFYGMHVTNQVPKSVRGGPTRDEIASRYIYMVNMPELREFWQLVARRKGASCMKYCPFQDIDIKTCLRTEHAPEQGHAAHRRAVYVRSRSLLETRIFRSSLNYVQVRANMEICHLTMMYCRSNEFSLTNLNNYYRFLEANMSDDLNRIMYRKNSPAMSELIQAAMKSKMKSLPDEDYRS